MMAVDKATATLNGLKKQIQTMKSPFSASGTSILGNGDKIRCMEKENFNMRQASSMSRTFVIIWLAFPKVTSLWRHTSPRRSVSCISQILQCAANRKDKTR